MKILLSAYACEPNRGSEAEIGWGIALELSKLHQVWVITRANNEAVHQAAFKKFNKPETLNFIYYDLPNWIRFYKKGNKNFLIYYYLWQIGSGFAAKQFLKKNPIDVVHHLTGGMDFFPSGFSFLKKPFIWGPIGGEDTHTKILSNLPRPDRMKEYKRIFLRFLIRHFDPFTRMTANRADLILLYSSKSALSSRRYLYRYRRKIARGIQTGLILDQRYENAKKRFRQNNPFTIIYAANLISWKGGRFVVQAFIKLVKKHNPDVRLVIVGDGPLKKDMHAALTEKGLTNKVTFTGFLPMQKLIDLLPKGDVFLYPTYHHGLANICLQAMVMGLPVVCLEGDGIQTSVEFGGGLAVPVENYDTIGDRLADSLHQLYKDRLLCFEMGQKARETVIKRFEYSVLAKQFTKRYLNTITNYESKSTD